MKYGSTVITILIAGQISTVIAKLENVQPYQILALIVCHEILIVLRIVDGGKMNAMMTFQISVMELQGNSKIIANIHVAIVSVKKIRIVRLICRIVCKDIAMLAYRIRSVRMVELALMGSAFALKNLREYIVKIVMTLPVSVMTPTILPRYLYKATVM